MWKRWRSRRPQPAEDAQWEAVVARIQANRADRRRALVGKEDVVAFLEELLFRHDPIGINFGENTDEYRPEAETIARRLPDATSVDDVTRIVHEELARWFGASIAGPREKYAAIAREIWSGQPSGRVGD
jgi:hypothetical protein